jgi:hypothetical protein
MLKEKFDFFNFFTVIVALLNNGRLGFDIFFLIFFDYGYVSTLKQKHLPVYTHRAREGLLALSELFH